MIRTVPSVGTAAGRGDQCLNWIGSRKRARAHTCLRITLESPRTASVAGPTDSRRQPLHVVPEAGDLGFLSEVRNVRSVLHRVILPIPDRVPHSHLLPGLRFDPVPLGRCPQAHLLIRIARWLRAVVVTLPCRTCPLAPPASPGRRVRHQTLGSNILGTHPEKVPFRQKVAAVRRWIESR